MFFAQHQIHQGLPSSIFLAVEIDILLSHSHQPIDCNFFNMNESPLILKSKSNPGITQKPFKMSLIDPKDLLPSKIFPDEEDPKDKVGEPEVKHNNENTQFALFHIAIDGPADSTFEAFHNRELGGGDPEKITLAKIRERCAM
jgi:hypothetical protein